MSETEDSKIIDDIKLEFRKNNLDNALLFICSLVAVIFSFLEILQGEVSILYFLPLFILSVILPFIYGYLIGAVIVDSPVERIKGWIYLVSGIMVYGLMLTYRGITNRFEYSIYLDIISILYYFIIGYSGKHITLYIKAKICEIYEYELLDVEDMILDYVSDSAFYLSLSGLFFVTYPTSLDEDSIFILSLVIFLFISFAFILIYESHKLNKIKTIPHKYVSRRRNKSLYNLGILLVIVFSFLLSFLFNNKQNYSSEIYNLMVIFLAVVATIGIILFYFNMPKGGIQFIKE